MTTTSAGISGAEAPASMPFPNYMQMRRRIPIRAWHAVRVVSVAAFLGLCVGLFLRPAGALFLFWRVVVPLLPLLFFVAPGLWRNICPLAAANQTPRLLGFTRGRTAPGWLKDRGYLVACALFLAVVSTRKVVFDRNGPALGVLLLAVIVAAFTGGFLLKGKSGWCSSVCPLLPVQRLYGQTPFVMSPNGHCQPCVGCTKNCYDFNPRVAYQADMYDDVQWSASRKLFAGAFPGIVVAYFTIPATPAISTSEFYLRFAGYVLISAGSFFALNSVLRTSASKLAAVYGATALNLFYWYTAPTLADAVAEITGVGVGWLVWPLRATVLALSLAWLARTFGVESTFVQQSLGLQQVRLAPSKARALGEVAAEGGPEVHVVPEERRVVTVPGTSLLEVIERDGLPIEAGCRMGMCGSDPVAIVEGMENLSAMADDEANTLRRLGLAANTRLACSARVRGHVRLSLTPEQGGGLEAPVLTSFDASVKDVVILGNGIAGVTAADFVRRSHPDCQIHLVGKEAHVLYNRMGISRLIYGRSAMQGLYLLPDSWYEEHDITCWLNTRARELDVGGREVTLGTGERLGFDRLILTMGSSSSLPPIPGYGTPGSFVLREAADAIAIRAYAQEHGASQAVVAGAGLLGLEAAYSLHQLGLSVTVLERGPRLLQRQIDDRCSQLLATYLKGLGIDVLVNSETAEVQGDQRVHEVALESGIHLPCDVFLVCAGIRPNVDLARAAGLEVRRGVVVDDHMRTSAPGVYAAGDVAELDDQVPGLWPAAVSQAEVAAVNAVGGDRRHVAALPPAVLKGVGIDLMSVGRSDGGEEDEVICVENPTDHSYGKLIVSEGKLVGAILLGRPLDSPHVMALVKNGTDVSERLVALRDGNWRVLDETVAPSTSAVGTPSLA